VRAFQRLQAELDATRTIALSEGVRATTLADQLDALHQDAMRYRALKTRHPYIMVTRLIQPGGGYSSARAESVIDAFADKAVAEVADWDATTPEARMANALAEVRQ
jgi:hypothetical protein